MLEEQARGLHQLPHGELAGRVRGGGGGFTGRWRRRAERHCKGSAERRVYFQGSVKNYNKAGKKTFQGSPTSTHLHQTLDERIVEGLDKYT